MKNVKTKIIAVLTAAILVAGIPGKQAAANSDQEVFGTIIGAAVGGLMGAQMGKGRGKLATTALGTLLGAGIGNAAAGHGDHRVFAPRSAPWEKIEVVHSGRRFVKAPRKHRAHKHHAHRHQGHRGYRGHRYGPRRGYWNAHNRQCGPWNQRCRVYYR